MSAETEQSWFRKIATVLMLASFVVGMTPFVKSWIYPTEKSRR